MQRRPPLGSPQQPPQASEAVPVLSQPDSRAGTRHCCPCWKALLIQRARPPPFSPPMPRAFLDPWQCMERCPWICPIACVHGKAEGHRRNIGKLCPYQANIGKALPACHIGNRATHHPNQDTFEHEMGSCWLLHKDNRGEPRLGQSHQYFGYPINPGTPRTAWGEGSRFLNAEV